MSLSRWMAGGLALSFLCGLSGCDPEFDRRSELKTLRVLAAQKSTPYALPGEDVTINLLWHDAEEDERDVQVVWTTGCFNPPADLYGLCLISPIELAQRFADLPDDVTGGFDLGGADAGVPEFDVSQLSNLADVPLVNLDGVEIPLPVGSYHVATGSQFTFQMPSDIITSRPPPDDRRVPAYGLAYVFFAVCAGELRFAPPGEQYPVACYDEDGERLGSEDFVAGYTGVYAYQDETLVNTNPEMNGFSIDGNAVTVDCHGAECLEEPVDTHDDCSDLGEDLTLPVCDDSETCDTFELEPGLRPSIVEQDAVLSRTRDLDIDEQMWVNYYVDRGRLSSELRLLNDSNVGWNDDFGVEYEPPEEPGPATVWAVVHDNRGGTDWVRVRLCIEE